jgi:hypothetical protein
VEVGDHGVDLVESRPALCGVGVEDDGWDEEVMCSMTGATSGLWEVRKCSASATRRARASAQLRYRSQARATT